MFKTLPNREKGCSELTVHITTYALLLQYMDGRLNEASKEDHMSGVVKQDRDKEREFEGGSERRWYHHPSIIKGYG